MRSRNERIKACVIFSETLGFARYSELAFCTMMIGFTQAIGLKENESPKVRKILEWRAADRYYRALMNCRLTPE